MMSVPTGTLKPIDDMGVFITTAIFCIFAYIWLFIVLKIWSPNYVSIPEAALTLLYFVILVILAFAADKYNAAKKRKLEKEKGIQPTDKRKFTVNQADFFHIVGVQEKKEKSQSKANAYNSEKDPLLAKQNNFPSNKGENIDMGNTDDLESNIKITKAPEDDQVKRMLNEVKRDKDGNIDVRDLASRVKKQPVQERVHYNRGIGGYLRGRNTIYNNIQNAGVKPQKTEKFNDDIGFNTLRYAVKEDKGPLLVKVLNKQKKEMKVGFRTVDGSATNGLDYHGVFKVLEFAAGQEFISVEIELVNDDIVEPDENFFVELYDVNDGQRLPGKDTITEVIIIDSDRPGILSFKERLVKVSENMDYAEIKIIRIDGSDGMVGCHYFSVEKDDNVDRAIEGVDFYKVDGDLFFEHNEIEKTIQVPILKKNDSPDREDTFEIRIERLSGDLAEKLEKNGGTHPKFSKKNFCLVEITGNLDFIESVEKVKKILEVEDSSWGSQFRYACMLAPTINEDGIQEVTCMDAMMHFLTITWKLLFALIPPRQYMGGWACFIIALIFIGAITAIVGEAATVFGCVIGLKPAVTAISFVALGTSLPDTFASRQAALESKTADAAIGNVTGSNSVNVFLGLGLPWMIASIYNKVKNDTDYKMNAGSLAFSVMLYLVTSCSCFVVLILRRCISGAELGGMVHWSKMVAGCFCILLWVIYLVVSSLEVYGYIQGF